MVIAAWLTDSVFASMVTGCGGRDGIIAWNIAWWFELYSTAIEVTTEKRGRG
jgi:hypothetical protein